MEDLKAKRGIIKASLTRFKTYFTGFKTSDNIQKLKVRLDRALPLLDEFENIQNQIDLLDSSEEQKTIREAFENAYFDVIADVKQVIETYSVSGTGSTTNLNNSYQNTSFENQMGIKLPIISLPCYNGSSEQWPSFRDTFNSLIGTNSALSDIQKFHYLRASLGKEPSELIQSLTTSCENYKTAWELLCERYEDKRLMTHEHVHGLFSLPNQGNDYSSLRQILDGLSVHLRALEVLGHPVQGLTNELIIYLVNTKLNSQTKGSWDRYSIKLTAPTVEDLFDFLKEQCQLKKLSISTKNSDPKPSKQVRLFSGAIQSTSCPICNKNHFIYNCLEFLSLSPELRLKSARNLKLCINCLRGNHTTNKCNSFKCRKCNKLHNTLLHFEKSTNDAQSKQSTSSVVTHSSQDQFHDLVLLSTAIVQVFDSDGKMHLCRALLDSGSQSNFITEDLAKRLNLKTTKVHMSISGINESSSKINYQTTVRFESQHNAFTSSIACLILPKITNQLPSYYFNTSTFNIPSKIKLADPAYNVPGNIDMLIGASFFWDLLMVGQIQLGKQKPILQKTQLGWIISGNVKLNSSGKISNGSTNCCTTSVNILNDQLAKFWQLEEVSVQNTYSKIERKCESHFIENTKRNSDGRFIVKIPFDSELVVNLGNSKNAAVKRFQHLEKTLQRKPHLKSEYHKFITEYIDLGHMTRIVDTDNSNNNFYLPHHAVIKESSLTTRVRVVFDGSAKTDSGISLNDIQLVGPTIQNDLLSIILRFRKHSIAVTADIEKMYRQVLVAPEQRKFQRILWRDNPTDTIETFELNTVTYGTASAPFLAIRSLCQLGLDCKPVDPVSSGIIANDFYVDDMLTGGDSLDEVIKIKTNVTRLLESGGFSLRKWLSNKTELMDNNNSKHENIIKFNENASTKTLGILWNSTLDTFQYSTVSYKISQGITKRSILSMTAQIYDPLGLLAPITIVAKLIIQKLWKLNISWDDESLPVYIHTQWLNFQDQLVHLTDLRVPRHALCSDHQRVELHGFSDASEIAYGACVYLKSVDNHGVSETHLLCARSRVAPLHNVTLPRLELCAAVLLARLAQKVKQSLQIHLHGEYYWCDSTITLAWIKAAPNKWKTFVANRVSEIQTLTDSENWYHVRSEFNAADIISRGISPVDLVDSSYWWHGPQFLSNQTFIDSLPKMDYSTLKEMESEMRPVSLVTLNQTLDIDIMDKYSTLTTLQRVIAYCLRFKSNCKITDRNRRSFGPLTVTELNEALSCIIKLTQQQAFKLEYDKLIKKEQISNTSKILSLAPFMDDLGIIRVGGRLMHSSFTYEQKHPIILPTGHKLTKLILHNEHLVQLHCGPQMLLASIRRKYWPLSGKQQARQIVHRCVACFRNKPPIYKPLMGNLPEARITQSFPFLHVGIDYAGPFLLKSKHGRGAKCTKAYISLFVCFATKAIHLELVSNLTSEAFLATLRRFIARRGKPQHLYSDNGTNFVGARSELSELETFLKAEHANVSEKLSTEDISWHFIPAKSPHMGGLWEAGVKSVKYHLKRVMGNAKLTFEDFYTVLNQIEAVLNSRPITPLSNDPNDFQALTPGHFLIGRPLTAAPDVSMDKLPDNRLSRYQYLQKLTQHFWSRWNKEYVAQLQDRVKWKVHNNILLKIGTLVLLREDTLPPLCWKLGRVVALHPGSDGVVRVVSVKCKDTIVKRAVVKVCALPIDED